MDNNTTEIPINIPTGFTHKNPQHQAAQQVETAVVYLATIFDVIDKLPYALDVLGDDQTRFVLSHIQELTRIGVGLVNFIEKRAIVIRKAEQVVSDGDVLNAGIVQ